MVMKKILFAIIVAVVITVVSGCSRKAVPTTLAYRSYDTECIHKGAGGDLTLRVWGEGRNSKDARNEAARKAVEEVIFSNLSGNKASNIPIVSSPTARQKNREYFNKFFSKGTYKKYVKAEKPEKSEYLSGNDRVVVPVVVTIDREGLVDRLKKDNIIQ